MARPASEIADRVAQRGRGIDSFIRKLEVLHARRELTRLDVERAYAGGFLAFFTSYEKAWEDLFFGLLMGRLTVAPQCVPLVQVRSEVVARRMVHGDRDYLDWLPIDRTTRRAAAYFATSHPFSRLTDGDGSVIKRYVLLRHALAHDSDHSTRQFRRHVIGQRVLPPHERRPAGYLRGPHATGQTRMNLAMAELTLVLTRVCA